MVDSNTKDFSQSIMELRYSWDKPDGTKETWEDICKRVGKHVLGVIDIPEEKKQEIVQAMIERKFIPGGRFLAQSGREVHQTQNCFLMRATDTREGWGELCDKATVALMSGGGIGVDYSDLRPKGSKLKRSGGVSSGCIPLIKVINEVGRGVMAGGNRRAAIYASLDWNHGDIFDFIHIKDWSEELRKIKEKDFDFPAPCDMTNISVNLDKSFFEAFENEDNPMHEHAQKVYWKVIHQMMKKAEPGFSINYKNKKESLRNAPVSGETWVVTPGKSVQIKNIVGQPTTIHTGYRWAENVVFELTEQDAEVLKIKLANGFELVLEPSHPVVIASKNGLRKIKAQNVKVGSQALVLNSEFMVETSEVVSISNAGTEDVYCADVHLPEHTFVANGIVVSNCTEIVSDKDSDVCCLGSLNFSKIESPEEVERIAELGIIFLLAGTLYSDVPYDKVDEVRNEYRRLGLGIMGMAIWYAQRGLPYGDEESIRPWLEAWKRASDKAAKKWAKEFGLNVPVATRAIAPNGCQKESTLIATDSGIIRLQELFSGYDEKIQQQSIRVLQDNEYSDVEYSIYNGVAKTKKVTLGSGIELEMTHNHKVKIIRNNIYDWVRADELAEGDVVPVRIGGYEKTTTAKLVDGGYEHCHAKDLKAEDMPLELSEDIAFFLGAYYANGSTHKGGIRFSMHADKYDDINRIVDIIKNHFGYDPKIHPTKNQNSCEIYFSSRALLAWLNANGLAKKKDMGVPRAIRTSSTNAMRAFIDGYKMCDGSKTGGTEYIDSTNKNMIQDLAVMLRLLGQNVRIKADLKRKASLGKSPLYRLYYVKTGSVGQDVNQIPLEWQERNRQVAELVGSTYTSDVIKSIEDGECVTLDIHVPNENYYIANSTISHNSTSIAGGQTTGGIEPIFAKAYQRRYLTPEGWRRQYVIDPFVEELYNQGADIDKVEDAYDLALDVERRVRFQAFVQDEFVDNAISSTINLPAYGEDGNNNEKEFGEMLYKYLPKLRGITAYPDGARGGQPLTKVDFEYAIKRKNIVFEAREDCTDGICGL